MAGGTDFDSADSQDRAETLDETNLTPDGEDIANFDDLVDVFDATSRADDGDVEGLQEAEDESEFTDDDVETITMSADNDRDDEGLSSQGDKPSPKARKPGVAGQEARTFESEDRGDEDTANLGYDDERKPPEHDPHTEEQLDHGLKETFPASDPVSINPGAD